MIKKFILVLAVMICALSLSITASAEMKRFKHFQADVPKGWTAIEKPSPDDPSASLVELRKGQGKQAPSLDLTVKYSKDGNAKKQIEFLRDLYGAKSFKKVKYGDGGYAHQRPDGNNSSMLTGFCHIGNSVTISFRSQGGDQKEAEGFLKTLKKL